MSLKLIYGRAKSKKGDLVFAEAAENNGIIIVPGAFTFLAEKKLSELKGTLGLDGSEVLSFERLAHRFSDFGPLGTKSLDSSGKNIAISLVAERLKKELTVLKSSSEHPGFSKGILDLICEFKRYSVTPENLIEASDSTEHKILSAKLRDIALIYSEYTKFLESGYTDRDDDLNRLCVFLSENKPLVGRHIFIDRFDRFTPQELSVIKELLLQCASVTVTLPLEYNSFEFQFLGASVTSDKLKKLAEDNNREIEEIQLKSSFDNPELSHIEQNYFSFEPKKYQKETKSVFLFSAKSLSSEVESVARSIRSLVKDHNIKYSDITVIVRDTAVYANAVKSIFPTFSIPYTDTESLSASLHSLGIYITSIADTVTSGFSREPLFRFLKSGFSPCSKEASDKLENYMLASGIHGSAFIDDEKWEYRTEVFSDYALSSREKADIEEADRIRKSLLPPFITLKEKLSGKISAEAFCRAIYDFTEETGLTEKIHSMCKKLEADGRNDESARLTGVYNAIMDAMDSLIASSGDALLPAKKFNAVFKEGIAATTMSIIPSSVDCVNFINAIRAKGISSKVTFIMGLNDGVFPKKTDKNGILSNSDRVFLKDKGIELSPDSEYQTYEELALIYSSLTSAEDKLFLSYSLHDESNKSITPSQVVHNIKDILPFINEDSDIIPLDTRKLISSPEPTLTYMLDALNRKALGKEIDEKWLMVYDWFLKNKPDLLPKIPNSLYSMRHTVPLSKEVTDMLFTEDSSSGVSKLEAYSSCPFKYFMRYIMNAQSRKIADFTPADTGSILHRYMDSVSRYIKDNNSSWSKLTEDEIKKVSGKVTEEIVENSSFYIKNSMRALYLIKRLQNLSVKMLTLVKAHFESGTFEPLGSELVFGKNGNYPEITINTKNGTLHLTGKIDRADVLHTERGDFIRIIDYKSGNKSFSLSDVYHGLNLQLSVYMLALNEHTKSKPAAMLYFKLDDPISNIDDKPEPVMNGIMLEDEEIMSAMDSSASGKSEFYKTSYATLENFDTLFAHVKQTIGNLYGEMKKGNFPISPKDRPSGTLCTYCDYKAVCASSGTGCPDLSFDSKNPWNEFQESLKKNDGGENL